MRSNMHSHPKRIAQFTLLILLLSIGAAAQEQQKSAISTSPPPGNWFSRLFYGYYASTTVQPFSLSDEGALDPMIKDGKLEITDEDAVRLALENNVDINVQRYTPY